PDDETKQKSRDRSENDVTRAFQVFSFLCEEKDLPRVVNLTSRRRARLEQLLSLEGNWTNEKGGKLHKLGFNGFVRVLNVIRNDPFYHGKNKHNWKINLDYLLDEDNFMRIVERQVFAPEKSGPSRDELDRIKPETWRTRVRLWSEQGRNNWP